MIWFEGTPAVELMESLNLRLIKEGFAHIEPHAEKITAYFYARLFTESPALRTLFPPSMETERDRLFRAVAEVVAALDAPGGPDRLLAAYGRAHRTFGICADHYPIMGRALRATLRRYAGGGWTGETETAWTTAFETAAEIMIGAAAEDAAARPAWWVGEVVEHDRRTPDIAVLTVRPDQRLPYEAGQYTAVQTARWPRVWRRYSIAGAPRDDGLLRFHVRARPAGWVGGALVRHTRVGDTLLLGPAAGAMTLDPGARRDVLCVAGGTGLGPLKALAEEALRTRPGHRVRLLVGARTAGELYDLPDLRSMAHRNPLLDVIPVVSGDPGFDGPHGRVTDVLDRFPDCSDHDVYVAGPPAMVEHAVANLRDLGVPAARIRHDPFDDDDGRPVRRAAAGAMPGASPAAVAVPVARANETAAAARPETAPARAVAPANATATATAAQAEPVQTEPANATAVQAEPANASAVTAEPAGTAPAKAAPARAGREIAASLDERPAAGTSGGAPAHETSSAYAVARARSRSSRAVSSSAGK